MTVREIYEYALENNLLDSYIVVRREDPDWDYDFVFDYPVHVCTHTDDEDGEEVMLCV